jgi:hypothetical protein
MGLQGTEDGSGGHDALSSTTDQRTAWKDMGVRTTRALEELKKD